MAGVVALLFIKRSQFRSFVLRKVGREMDRKRSINAKHAKAGVANHDKAEGKQFSSVKARDKFRYLAEVATNAANHADALAEELAALGRGD